MGSNELMTPDAKRPKMFLQNETSLTEQQKQKDGMPNFNQTGAFQDRQQNSENNSLRRVKLEELSQSSYVDGSAPPRMKNKKSFHIRKKSHVVPRSIKQFAASKANFAFQPNAVNSNQWVIDQSRQKTLDYLKNEA